MQNTPLVSCLCVTEDRPAFVPWLLWSFERQSWPNKELVIVDSSRRPLELDERPDVRIVRAPHGTRVPEKRNIALDAARGELVAWFDDDDWQHPERLRRLVEELGPTLTHAGSSESFFYDFGARRCARYAAPQGVIFNGAVFRASAARAVRFDAARVRASDSSWMAKVSAAMPGGVVPGGPLFFWLSHGSNLSNPIARVRCDLSESVLRETVGAAWQDTDDELERLRSRLASESTARPAPAPTRRPEVPAGLGFPRIIAAWSDRTPFYDSVEGTTPAPAVRARAAASVDANWEAPPVSAFVKATILDARYLAVMVPHMFARAGCRLVHRAIVVDPRPEFAGKYQNRPRGTRAELDDVLADLMARNIVDRVLEVPGDSPTIASVMTKYFGAEGEHMPTHAVTGGPIYPTLFGLESMPTDHVLQLDADVFFHADGVSWVEEGLKLLSDPSTWLVMTHAGPPAGPVGTRASLGPKNARRARWDATRGVWQFKSASTRYFLTDRRRLRGKLPVLWHAPGEVLPLEQCLGAGLKQSGAFRVNLAREGSWDLHAHNHGDPFPAWAERIAELVTSGAVPPTQRGQYDLRLDVPPRREAWRGLVEAPPEVRSNTADVFASASGPIPSSDERTPSVRTDTRASTAVVMAIRDRAGERVRNALASLDWQKPRRPMEVLVVSLGSRPEIDEELSELCRAAGARLLRAGRAEDPWCKPLALNLGIRATDPSVRFVMTMDADMILAQNFLEVVEGVLYERPRAFALCQSSDLSRMCRVPSTPATLETQLPALKRRSRLRGEHGTGGIQAAERSFFFEVRGYDEDMTWWGAEDGDMAARAARAGREMVWVTDGTYMLHQWHPKRHSHLVDAGRRAEARVAWERNHELMRKRDTVARNPLQWGGAP